MEDTGDEFGTAQARHARSRVLERQHHAAGQLPDRLAQFLVGDAVLCELLELGGQQLDHAFGLRRGAAGVHAEVAGVRVRCGERVGGVHQAALLADLLEEARGHAAAEYGVEHAHHVAAFVGCHDARAAHDDVDLLDGAADDLDALRTGDLHGFGGAARDGSCVLRQFPAGLAQGSEHQVADHVVVEGAGGGDHQLVRGVEAAVVFPDRLTADAGDGLRGTADRAAQGVLAEDCLDEALVGDVPGVVGIHGDFLEDHVAFLLEFVGVDHCGGDHVRDDVDGHGQVGVQHAGEVAGAFLGGCRVGFAADLVEGRGDFHGGAALGALEQQVLQEVRGTVLAVLLVAGTHADPEADGRRTLAGHRLGQHADSAGKHGAAHQGASGLAVDDRGVSRLDGCCGVGDAALPCLGRVCSSSIERQGNHDHGQSPLLFTKIGVRRARQGTKRIYPFFHSAAGSQPAYGRSLTSRPCTARGPVAGARRRKIPARRKADRDSSD